MKRSTQISDLSISIGHCQRFVNSLSFSIENAFLTETRNFLFSWKNAIYFLERKPILLSDTRVLNTAVHFLLWNTQFATEKFVLSWQAGRLESDTPRVVICSTKRPRFRNIGCPPAGIHQRGRSFLPRWCNVVTGVAREMCLSYVLPRPEPRRACSHQKKEWTASTLWNILLNFWFSTSTSILRVTPFFHSLLSVFSGGSEKTSRLARPLRSRGVGSADLPESSWLGGYERLRTCFHHVEIFVFPKFSSFLAFRRLCNLDGTFFSFHRHSCRYLTRALSASWYKRTRNASSRED